MKHLTHQFKLSILASGLAIAAGLNANLALADNNLTSEPELSTNDGITQNIVNGTITQEGSRSYQAMLVRNGQQFCGGTLIADYWVLTAAHCLDNVSAQSIEIRLGAHYKNSGTSHNVTQKIVHQNWQGANNIENGYDIALLKLSTPAASNLVRAALPTQAIQDSAAGVGKLVTVSGWGLTSHQGQSSNVLREVDLPVISTSQCRQQLSQQINNTSICGGGPNGKSACNGDSGGPFVAKHNNTFYSFGVVSWGKNCSGATAFTRTLSYLNWINSHTGGDNPDPGGNETTLTNGQGVSVSGSQGSQKFYKIDVPAGASNLQFATSGGSGDLDMYVKFGSKPTTSSYDCRPYKSGNNESCPISNAQAGTYYVMLAGYSSYSGATLKGSYSGSDNNTSNELTNGRSVQLSGSQGSSKVFTMQVPSNASNLNFQISGGSGDADLYVKYGSEPTDSSYDCRPYKSGNNESCPISNVRSGTYYVVVKAYQSYSNLSLVGSYN